MSIVGVTNAAEGLLGEYYHGTSGDPWRELVLERIDPTVDFNWGSASPDASINADGFTVRWTGMITVPASATYTFYTSTDDGIRLWVNGEQLIDNWTDHGTTEDSGNITLAAGRQYEIIMEYYENGGGAVCELSFVDDQSRVRLASDDRVEDPVERQDPVGELVAEGQPEGQERRGHRPGDRDRLLAEIGDGHRTPGDHQRAVSVTHARAGREEGVAIGQRGVGVDGQGRDLELAGLRPAVEALDVVEHLDDLEPSRVDLAGGQAVEHEGVVGVRAVADPDARLAHGEAPVLKRIREGDLSRGLRRGASFGGALTRARPAD